MISIFSSFLREDPASIRLRAILGWAAADYVYVIEK